VLFVAGGAARTTVPLITINETTTSYYFHRLRQLIYDNSDHLEMFTGEVEVDENYFGRRIKSKRYRSAGGKVPVFSLFKRNGKVYSIIIPDAKSDTLLPIN
jgi:transposase